MVLVGVSNPSGRIPWVKSLGKSQSDRLTGWGERYFPASDMLTSGANPDRRRSSPIRTFACALTGQSWRGLKTSPILGRSASMGRRVWAMIECEGSLDFLMATID